MPHLPPPICSVRQQTRPRFHGIFGVCVHAVLDSSWGRLSGENCCLFPFLLNQVPSWPSKQSTTHTSKGHQNLLYPRRSSLSCSPEYNVPLNSQTLVISFPLSFFSTFESQLNICWPQFSSKKKAPPPRSVLKKGENESSTCGPGS